MSATVASRLAISSIEASGARSDSERPCCKNLISSPEKEGLFQPSDGCTDRQGVTETKSKKFQLWQTNIETREQHLPLCIRQ